MLRRKKGERAPLRKRGWAKVEVSLSLVVKIKSNAVKQCIGLMLKPKLQYFGHLL